MEIGTTDTARAPVTEQYAGIATDTADTAVIIAKAARGAHGTDAADTAITHQQAAIAAHTAHTVIRAGTGESGTALPAVAEQPGRTAGKTGDVCGGTVGAGPAVAEQEPAGAEVADGQPLP
ncbi:hypothetical protein BST25_19550 [Mycobacterium heidelbergense]|uniref:Uncharacterized protein n=1 Tax=Mycobacterium heidelbergense TaxID=53376 RepID=A0A1X0DD61_MYCHE|nr:hypothetical protein BST25_19550 [Mycobacterium heidelbergense]